jgi:acetyl-CoA acetyltransferase
MYEFGTKREHLAEVAVAARRWALLNPKAWEKEPLTIEDVLNARRISDPLGVRDCCLVSDGGGAIIVTSAERAKSMKRPPVYVLGNGQSTTHRRVSNMADFTVSPAVKSGKEAYAMAGVGPKDINVAELYDCFTITPIMFLEDLGFCKKGEGGPFVEGGAIAPGGRFPVNTSGGGLSYCHPGHYGILLLIEATRQLRGECGPRQVANCEVALCNGNGAEFATEDTVILGSAATV